MTTAVRPHADTSAIQPRKPQRDEADEGFAELLTAAAAGGAVGRPDDGAARVGDDFSSADGARTHRGAPPAPFSLAGTMDRTGDGRGERTAPVAPATVVPAPDAVAPVASRPLARADHGATPSTDSDGGRVPTAVSVAAMPDPSTDAPRDVAPGASRLAGAPNGPVEQSTEALPREMVERASPDAMRRSPVRGDVGARAAAFDRVKGDHPTPEGTFRSDLASHRFVDADGDPVLAVRNASARPGPSEERPRSVPGAERWGANDPARSRLQAGTSAEPAVRPAPTVAGIAPPSPRAIMPAPTIGSTITDPTHALRVDLAPHALQPAAPVPPARTDGVAGSATSSNGLVPPTAVGSAVASLLRTGRVERLTMVLEPAALGRVEVEIVRHGRGLSIELTTETMAALRALEAERASIETTLRGVASDTIALDLRLGRGEAGPRHGEHAPAEARLARTRGLDGRSDPAPVVVAPSAPGVDTI